MDTEACILGYIRGFIGYSDVDNPVVLAALCNLLLYYQVVLRSPPGIEIMSKNFFHKAASILAK